MLEVRGIVAGYHETVDILRDVSIKVAGSSITAVIGPNGAGKSTLLKAIYSIIKPRKGEVYFRSERITGVSPHKLIQKGLAYVPQHRSLFPALTVQENLRVSTWLFRSEKRRINDVVGRILGVFPELRQLLKLKAGLLSGGQQKILELAMTLVREPKMLLVDEPTAGLAPAIAVRIYDYLRKLVEIGITILLVDQNVRQAVKLADYVYELELGRIRSEGPGQEFESLMEKLVSEWI